MKVQLVDGVLQQMSKSLPREQVTGENVGLIYLNARTAAALRDIATRLVAEGRTKDWLGTAVQVLARKQPLRGVDVAGIPWAEVDFAYDLDRARKQVWPAIRRGSHRGSRRRRAMTIAAASLIAMTFGTAAFDRQSSAMHPDEWTTLQLNTATAVTLSDGGREQRWWLLLPGSAVEVEMEGAGDLRIESRVILPEDAASLPYRFDIDIAGQTHWAQHEAIPSGTVRHHDARVSTAQYYVVRSPAGVASVRLSAMPGIDVPILLRLRQTEQLLCDDVPASQAPTVQLVGAAAGPARHGRRRTRPTGRNGECPVKL
jgi:hypothetical protein